MPVDKYMVIRKAAEIEEISLRLRLISDINAAFSGNENHINNLQKLHSQLVGIDDFVSWDSDPNWKQKLSKWKR